MDMEAKKATVRRIKKGLEITEISCTRVVKGSHGSTFVGLTAAMDSSTSLLEAEAAVLVLGARVDQLTYDRALAGRVISSEDHEFASRHTRANYHTMMSEALDKLEKSGETGEAEALDLEIEEDPFPSTTKP